MSVKKNQINPVSKIPQALQAIEFKSRNDWLAAHMKHKPETVIRAVLLSFRKRYLLSMNSAAKKCGVSPKAWCEWENGKAKMRFNTKLQFIENGWLMPFHFGINIVEGTFQE